MSPLAKFCKEEHQFDDLNCRSFSGIIRWIGRSYLSTAYRKGMAMTYEKAERWMSGIGAIVFLGSAFAMMIIGFR